MTNDMFASLQAFPKTQPKTQNHQPKTQKTPANETTPRSERFANLMNKCSTEKEAADVSVQNPTNQENDAEPQTMAFIGSKSFPQSVMDILAGEAEPDEAMPEPENEMPSQETADDDGVIWPDDETAPKAEGIPAENEHPAQQPVKDSAPVPDGANDASQKVTDEPAKNPDEPEEDTAIQEASVEIAGLAGVMASQPQTLQPEIQDTHSQPERSAVSSQASRQRRTQPETQAALHEQQETPDTQEARADISVNREAFSEDEGNPDAEQQNPNPQNQNQDHSQPQTQSRKTDTRSLKTEAVSQKTDTETRRTESHSDFGTYFEGVLNSRRTAARTSQPMPLNLRTAENFTQASALRDGLTNVVRFIRADGVQKARVIVDPPALGRVSVELTSGTSGVEASIKVASEQIRQLVQDQLSQLRMNLSQQGVQVAEFTVDVQQDNSGNHSQQEQEQNTGRFGFVDDSDDDEAEDFRIDLEEGLLWWVA